MVSSTGFTSISGVSMVAPSRPVDSRNLTDDDHMGRIPINRLLKRYVGDRKWGQKWSAWKVVEFLYIVLIFLSPIPIVVFGSLGLGYVKMIFILTNIFKRLESKQTYPPVNKHSNGKSPSWIGNTSSNGGFSIAMLDYRRVPVARIFDAHMNLLQIWPLLVWLEFRVWTSKTRKHVILRKSMLGIQLWKKKHGIPKFEMLVWCSFV